jgi:hypothetical protein
MYDDVICFIDGTRRNIALQDSAELRNVSTVRGGDSCRYVVSDLVLLCQISI